MSLTNTLLVPVYLDALVINKKIQDAGITYNRFQMDYSRLNNYASPMFPPFEDQKTSPLGKGVHLHWALPDGLTRGLENADNSGLDFPYVPNRWLVLRVQANAGHTTVSPFKAWVLISDEIGEHGSNPFLNPHQLDSNGNVIPTRLGSNKTLDQWNEMMGEKGTTAVKSFLKAIGPGHVTFAAFSPGIDNVFGFYDDLTDNNTPLAATKLTYLVVGWYSEPSLDPLCQLTPKQWQPATQAADYSVAENLNWAVNLNKSAPPTNTMLHGLVVDADWNPNGPLTQPTNYPDNVSKRVRVAVGNTAIDALAAMVKAHAADAQTGTLEAKLLEAFQYNLIPELAAPGGDVILDQKIRQHWYGSSPGGTRWMIVDKTRADTSKPQEPATITTAQATWLAALNVNQRELDIELRLLASLQQQLYDLWWKNGRIQYLINNNLQPTNNQDGFNNAADNLPDEIDLKIIDSFINQVIAQMCVVVKKAQNIPMIPNVRGGVTQPDPIEQMYNRIKTHCNLGIYQRPTIAAYAQSHKLDMNSLALKPTAMPRFWHPTDPVVLVTGLGRTQKHGEDGTLACRLASQALTTLNVSYQGSDHALTAATLQKAMPQLTGTYLPSETAVLLDEAFLLDPNNAAIIAQNALPGAAAEVATAIKGIKQTVPKQISTIGDYGRFTWEQPWSPLYLDWQVNFYYTFQADPQNPGGFLTDDNGDYLFDQKSWQFDGTNFNWIGGTPNAQNVLSFSGRTFLTPQASFSFMSRLQDYLSKHADATLQEIETFLEQLSQWDILSQSLDGFSDKLALHDIGQNVPPSNEILPFVTPNYHGVPFTAGVPDQDTDFGAGSPFFFPIRAGFFTIESLRVIDSFGRTLNLMEANDNPGGNAQAFKPIKAKGLALSTATKIDIFTAPRLLKLAPRLVQNSQLTFRYMSAVNDQEESNLTAVSNPICGWLLPNHLDQSVVVYDADGNLLGELMLLHLSATEQVVNWQPAPNNPNNSPAENPQDTLDIPNPHLKGMLTTLLKRNDNGAGFANFLRVIDETLWTIDPHGQRDDPNLSVLIGRPLAVVRANIQLHLDGNPFHDQAFYKTFQEDASDLANDPGATFQNKWPVRLGNFKLRNDGLIGYFQGDPSTTDYTHFHAVHLPTSDFAPAKKPYIQQQGANGDYITLKFKQTAKLGEPVKPFDNSESAYLTMLVDPRGVVHANTGLLPTKEIEIPNHFVTPALATMAVTFRAGPLLIDPVTIRIPTPTETKGVWSWIQATGTQKGDWAKDPIVKADAKAHIPTTPLILREGWLEFKPNDIEN